VKTMLKDSNIQANTGKNGNLEGKHHLHSGKQLQLAYINMASHISYISSVPPVPW
jgi:hypothetical protein